jgi:hypothetical protein
MAQDMEALYQQRLKRYTTALRKGKPDKVPIRPFVAEFICNVSGYTCQEVTQDFELAFEATRKCCLEFDWDATVPNMVYLYGTVPQVVGLRYYGVPGVGLSPNVGFNYVEPPEDSNSFMQPDEYDALIADPTGYLFSTWLPRVSTEVVRPGQPATLRNNLSFLKGGMTVMNYFSAFPRAIERMRKETGTVSAIAGILKAPLDILADKLRGYMGLCMDLMEQPDKVLAACEALQPHMFQIALASADPTKTLPISIWMHRGCVPFVSQEHFDKIMWPTLKPIVLELWKRGHQVLFYAEGKWGAHLKTFRELPAGSIIFHCDRDDIFEVHRVLGDKFAISGGIPNVMLAYGKPEEVRDYTKKVIQTVARDGGYILDAGAIVQNDAKVENIRAMTAAGREFGVY